MNERNIGESTIFLAHRHSKKGKPDEGPISEEGKFYPGITSEGEQIVRERTREDVLRVIEEAPAGAVVLFAGASDYPRTKSSSRVSGDELKKLLADQPDKYLVLEQEDVDSLVSDPKKESTIHLLRDVAASNTDKKIVINYPLYIEELSMDTKSKGKAAGREDWKEDGAISEKARPYAIELLKRNNNNEIEAVLDWVRSNGQLQTEDGQTIEGPSPLGTAREYLHALTRLESVSRKMFPDRPLVIEVTGHSWDIDVFIAYLTHQGRLDESGVKEIAQGIGEKASIISEFESPVIKIEQDKAKLSYRGRIYPIDDFDTIKKENQDI